MTDEEVKIRDYARVEWPAVDWTNAAVRVGAFHIVVIPSTGPILRLTTGIHFDTRAQREARTLQAIAGVALPVPIPHVIAGPVESDDWSATLITRVPGHQIDDVTTATPERIQSYADLLTALHAAKPSTMHELPARRTWCGGDEWPALVRHELAPLLNPDAQRSASDRIAQLLDIEASPSVLCHGDFGPHNILWNDNRPASLIDLDHACIGDPAIDLAPLIGFHGLPAIRPIADRETLRRAMIHRATLSLQVAAAAHLNGSFDLRDHALDNFATRNAQGTLFEPTGMTPANL